MSNHDAFGPIDEEAELLVKALAKCRICKHIKMAHSFVKAQKGRCIDAMVTKEGKYFQCLCKEYTPLDNLEYLEWRNDQKKKTRKNNS
jgi:hypothetical protein